MNSSHRFYRFLQFFQSSLLSGAIVFIAFTVPNGFKLLECNAVQPQSSSFRLAQVVLSPRLRSPGFSNQQLTCVWESYLLGLNELMCIQAYC